MGAAGGGRGRRGGVIAEGRGDTAGTSDRRIKEPASLRGCREGAARDEWRPGPPPGTPETSAGDPRADTPGPGSDGPALLAAAAVVAAAERGWCWMVVLGAWLISFLLAGFTLSFTIVYQQLSHHYGESASRTAWVLATYGAVRMFSSPMVSALCNAYSHRQVAFIGGVINSVAMALSGYAPNLEWLYLIFGLVGGFSSNMVYLPPFPVIGYYFERRRGLAMALASTGSGLGGVVMAPLIEILFRTYGYSGGMLIIGGLMLNCCVASALLRPVTSARVSGAAPTTRRVPTLEVRTRSNQGHSRQLDGKPLSAQLAWYYGSAASFGSFLSLDKDRLPMPNGYQLCSDGAEEPQHPKSSPINKPLARIEANCGSGGGDGGKYDSCFEINQEEETQCGSPHCNGAAHHRPGFAEDTGTEKKVPSAVAAVATGGVSGGAFDGGGGGFSFLVGRLKCAFARTARLTSDRMDLELLVQPEFLLYCLMMLGYYTCFTTTNTFISGIALDIGFSEAQVALMLTASYALDTPSRLLSGAIFDVHALRRLHVPIMTGLGMVASVTAVCLPLPTSTPGLFVLWAAYQFVFNGNQAQQVPLTVEIVGVHRAMSACGLARVFMGVGEVIGPTMGGAIKDKTGSYHLAFYIAGSAFILGCVIFQTYDTFCRIYSKKTKDLYTVHTEEILVTA